MGRQGSVCGHGPEGSSPSLAAALGAQWLCAVPWGQARALTPLFTFGSPLITLLLTQFQIWHFGYHSIRLASAGEVCSWGHSPLGRH